MSGVLDDYDGRLMMDDVAVLVIFCRHDEGESDEDDVRPFLISGYELSMSWRRVLLCLYEEFIQREMKIDNDDEEENNMDEYSCYRCITGCWKYR